MNQTIHTGSYILNAHYSGSILKGVPRGEIVSIGGDPKTGKSFLAINIAINGVFDGLVIYIFETEGSPTKDRIIQHGINTNYRQYYKWTKSFIAKPGDYKFFLEKANYLSKDKKSINVDFLTEILSEQTKIDKEQQDAVHIKFLAAIVKSLQEDNSLSERNVKNLLKYDFVFYRLKKAIIVEQPETVEDVIETANTILGKFLDEKKKVEQKKDAVYESPDVYFMLDSYTALNTRSQYENAEGDKGVKSDMGTFAKMGKALFNMIAIRCNKLGIGWLNTVHVYEKDMGNYRQRTPSGGNGPIFLSAVLPLMRKSVDKDKETKEKKGILITSDMMESRHAKPTSVEVYLGFERGMNAYYGLDKYVTWEVCGITRGRFDEFVDLANELITKKILTKEEFLKSEFTYEDFVKNLSKAKAEALEGHIETMMDHGWLIKVVTGAAPKQVTKFKFTEKLFKAGYTTEDGKYTKQGVNFLSPVFNPNSPKWIIKHLGMAVETKELFTHDVFTDDVLQRLDAVISPQFVFGQNESSELEKLLEAAPAGDDLDAFTV